MCSLLGPISYPTPIPMGRVVDYVGCYIASLGWDDRWATGGVGCGGARWANRAAAVLWALTKLSEQSLTTALGIKGINRDQ